MPTETSPSSQTARLVAARDEALRRYAEHLAAVQLKNSRWNSQLSRRRPVALTRTLLSAPSTGPKGSLHAH